MQSLATAITRERRIRKLWAWSHMENFLLTHPDPNSVRIETLCLLDQLHACRVCINPKYTILHRTTAIKVFGFYLHGNSETIRHASQRLHKLRTTPHAALVPQTPRTLQRIAWQ